MEPQDITKQEMWSDTRRVIREALDARARCAVIWPDFTKDQSDRDRAKLQADQAEDELRDMVKGLFDAAHAARPVLAEVDDLRFREATLRAELAKLKGAILLQHAEREAQGRLLRALINRLSNDQVAQVFGDQVGYMADLIHEQQLTKASIERQRAGDAPAREEVGP